MIITNQAITGFERYLRQNEREPATVTQYIRAVRRLSAWLDGRAADKELMLKYKEQLKTGYSPASVNAAIAAINGFAVFMDRPELKLHFIKMQKKIFSDPERELSRAEYNALVTAAQQTHKTRLLYILQTMFATGIRVSEDV